MTSGAGDSRASAYRGAAARAIRRRAWFLHATSVVDVGVMAQPFGEVGFGQLAFREGKYGYVFVLVAGFDFHVVERKESPVADVGGALVAVHERVGVVARQPEGERGGQVDEVRRRNSPAAQPRWQRR